MQITTIGLDIAKNVFQVHGIDGNETVVVRKQLRRGKLIAFFEIGAVPCRHRSLCHGAPLGTRTDEARPPGAIDASEGRQGLRQAQQERRR